MKKFIFIILFLLTRCDILFSQQNAISNNGKYVYATIRKSLDFNDFILVIQKTNSSWKKEIKSGEGLGFTPDSKNIFFKVKDTLFVLNLETTNQIQILNVASFKQPRNGKGQWFAYQLGNARKEMILFNFLTGKSKSYKDVSEYDFNENGTELILTILNLDDTIKPNSIYWIDLKMEKEIRIYSGRGVISNMAFDKEGDQIAMLIGFYKQSEISYELWYFKTEMSEGEVLASEKLLRNKYDLLISDSYLSFSQNGSKIFFRLKDKNPQNPKPGVDVWSYTDAKIQSFQLGDTLPRSYFAVIFLDDRHILRLEETNEIIVGSPTFFASGDLKPQINDEYALLFHWDADKLSYESYLAGLEISPAGTNNESEWNNSSIFSVFLVCLKNGLRMLINNKIESACSSFPVYQISPDGRFVVYYSPAQKNYFSYEIKTELTRNITHNIPGGFAIEDSTQRVWRFYNSISTSVQWRKNNASFLISDHYGDIWQVDPFNSSKAINITKGYGRKYSTAFEFVQKKAGDTSDETILEAIPYDPYINSGYYSVEFNGATNPKVLIKIGGIYKINNLEKATNGNFYLIERENASEPICFYSTNDFINYNKITSSQTDKRRAISQEVIKWKSFNGKMCVGILCKPDNFDSSKKYPIIFTYYENNVLNYNAFRPYGEGDAVDSGYLVFAPDINFEIGETGQSAFNSVVSAARLLIKRSYVDRLKMGLLGGSFSGYETNFIITHTNIFAAAYSAAGVSDLISLYGTEDNSKGGVSYSELVVQSQLRIGVTPWDRPDIYIKNSPIFYADKVTTPILLVHNKKDLVVPFSQGIEFFKALRRLGKRAWLLQYDNGAHSGSGGTSFKDYSYRSQFFNHYLKGSPAPLWMLSGIPAKYKGVHYGLELDSLGRTPGPGLLYKKEIYTPQQKNLLRHRTMVNSEGRIVNVR